MIVMIFLVGALSGTLAGGAICVRYLRREIAADVGPKLKRIQLQLDSIDTEINLALTTRLADLSSRSVARPPLPRGEPSSTSST